MSDSQFDYNPQTGKAEIHYEHQCFGACSLHSRLRQNDFDKNSSNSAYSSPSSSGSGNIGPSHSSTLGPSYGSSYGGSSDGVSAGCIGALLLAAATIGGGIGLWRGVIAPKIEAAAIERASEEKRAAEIIAEEQARLQRLEAARLEDIAIAERMAAIKKEEVARIAREKEAAEALQRAKDEEQAKIAAAVREIEAAREAEDASLPILSMSELNDVTNKSVVERVDLAKSGRWIISNILRDSGAKLESEFSPSLINSLPDDSKKHLSPDIPPELRENFQPTQTGLTRFRVPAFLKIHQTSLEWIKKANEQKLELYSLSLEVRYDLTANGDRESRHQTWMSPKALTFEVKDSIDELKRRTLKYPNDQYHPHWIERDLYNALKLGEPVKVYFVGVIAGSLENGKPKIITEKIILPFEARSQLVAGTTTRAEKAQQAAAARQAFENEPPIVLKSELVSFPSDSFFEKLALPEDLSLQRIISNLGHVKVRVPAYIKFDNKTPRLIEAAKARGEEKLVSLGISVSYIGPTVKADPDSEYRFIARRLVGRAEGEQSPSGYVYVREREYDELKSGATLPVYRWAEIRISQLNDIQKRYVTWEWEDIITPRPIEDEEKLRVR